MRFTLADCTLIDGTGRDPITEAALCVEDGRIAWTGPLRELPEDMRQWPRHDAPEQIVIPGLIDAHVHVSWNGREGVVESSQRPRDQLLLEGVTSLRSILASGTTTVRDVGGQDYVEMSLRWAVEAGHIPGPRMRTSGKIITMTGGHAYFAAREADGPEELRKAAREQMRAGADTIKLMATGGFATAGQDVNASQFTVDEMAAAVQAAHSMGRAVAAHCHGAGGIKNALLAGVDSIEHGSYLDEETADLMVERGAALVFTLGYVDSDPATATPAAIAEAERMRAGLATLSARLYQTVALARAKGILIGSGSDAGGSAVSPHDFSMASELEELVARGMSPWEAITVVTRNNARILRLDRDLGTLEPGHLADFVLLGADPIQDIRNVRQVRAVYKGGVRMV